MAEKHEPVDPSLVSNFTDLDALTPRIVQKFAAMWPDFKGIVVHRTIDDENYEVHFRIEVVLSATETIVEEVTFPIYRVSPLKGEPN